MLVVLLRHDHARVALLRHDHAGAVQLRRKHAGLVLVILLQRDYSDAIMQRPADCVPANQYHALADRVPADRYHVSADVEGPGDGLAARPRSFGVTASAL